MVILQPDLEIEDLNYTIYDNLVWELNNNHAWKRVAETFEIFSISDIRSFERNPSPSTVLLDEIGIRACTVGGLCEVLEQCQLYSALSLLSEPEPLQILNQPGDGSEDPEYVSDGGQLRLEIVARGLPPPTYLWYHGNEELLDQTSNILCIDDFGLQHEGDYYCCLSQPGFEAEVFSDVVSVELLPQAPYIEEQPTSVACRVGEEVIFSCVCGGYPDPQVQWIFGNTVLQGEDNSKLVIPCAELSDDGIYYCCVSNKCGELYSDPVKISVYEYDDCGVEPIGRIKLTVTEKVALLIANDKYNNLNPLNTPSNDVITLSVILKHLGFKVLALQNLTLVEMRSAVRVFCRMLPEGAYGIFYFVGHGFDMQGKFMLPVDAPDPSNYLRSDSLCEREVIRDVLETMPQLFLILLDMCLKVPCSEENPGIHEERTVTFPFQPRRNLIQGYATTSSLGAYEQIKEPNGVYMKHLKKFLDEDCPIVKILEKVNESISNEPVFTSNVQMPSYTNNVVVGLHYLTHPSEDNDETKALYEKYTSLPPPRTVLFRRLNKVATASFHLLGDCFQNVLQIRFKNLQNWMMACETHCFGLTLQLQRLDNDLVITIYNLQKVKIPNISINIKLFDKQTRNLIDNSLLDLEEKILISSAALWFDPHVADDSEDL